MKKILDILNDGYWNGLIRFSCILLIGIIIGVELVPFLSDSTVAQIDGYETLIYTFSIGLGFTFSAIGNLLFSSYRKFISPSLENLSLKGKGIVLLIILAVGAALEVVIDDGLLTLAFLLLSLFIIVDIAIQVWNNKATLKSN